MFLYADVMPLEFKAETKFSVKRGNEFVGSVPKFTYFGTAVMYRNCICEELTAH